MSGPRSILIGAVVAGLAACPGASTQADSGAAADAAGRDAGASDAPQPDIAMPDGSAPDATPPDRSHPDRAAFDQGTIDGAGTDLTAIDSHLPDLRHEDLLAPADGGSDATTSDAALGDAASGDAARIDAAAGRCTDLELAAIEDQMASRLEASRIADFTLLLETEDGRTFSFDHGTSTRSTAYEGASTSKWVTAAVLLDSVERGALRLDSTAHEILDFWTEPAVNLGHLLSFRSGFIDDPVCMRNPAADFASCVQQIYSANEATALPPGASFDYSGTHLQVAGLMAIEATGAVDWAELFDAFRARTGLLPSAVYDWPSTTNPGLAGGLQWTGEEYLGFLRALYHGQILSSETRAAMHANQRGGATMGNSPAYSGLGEDWAYGYGNWLECPTATTPGSYDCGEGHRNSSPGAYGAYPFIDFEHRYFGVVALQGRIFIIGINLFRTIEADAVRWATRDCAG